eukprot:4553587-Prymnesium_polylepis.1
MAPKAPSSGRHTGTSSSTCAGQARCLGNPWPVLPGQSAEWAVESYQRSLFAPRRQVGAVVRGLG